MTGTIRWASRALLTLLVTSVVLFGMGQAGQAAPRTSPAADAAAKASAELAAQGYVVQFGADGALTVSGPAVSDPAAPAANGAPGADAAAPRLSWSYTFSKETTLRIWNFFLAGSATGITAICAAIAPGWVLDAGCAIVANAIIQFLDAAGNPNGRCLRITVSTRLGWPPISVSVRYVTC